jgi:4-amino-4-deoxy-L-arabinose transferase-like glycosyltransferase
MLCLAGSPASLYSNLARPYNLAARRRSSPPHSPARPIFRFVSLGCMLLSAMRERILSLGTSPWFIALVAMVLRTGFLIYKAHSIPAGVLATVPFQNEVGNVASALAQGHGFCCLFRQPTGPTAWLAPVYPLVLACIFELLGIFTLWSFYAAVLLNCVFSSLACVPLFYAGKRMGGPATATLASWLWAIFPSGIILPFEWIWDTSLSALLAAALLWATLELADSSRRRDFVLYGLLWGFSLLTNPTLGALLPFLLGWVLYQHHGNRVQHARPALLAFAVILLACLPWTARNYVQFHRFIPLRSNFPFEFWSGNNEIFDEHSHEVNRITRYEQIHLYAKLGESAFLDEKWQKAKTFVATHPLLYAQLFGRRVIATWLGTESPWQDFARTDSWLARFLFFWNVLALLGVIAGLIRLFLRQRRYLFPVASFPLILPLTFYIAHTTLRHRHPCDPVLALLMAVAMAKGVSIKRF